MNQLPDSEIIRLIQSGNRDQQNTAFRCLYRTRFGLIESMVVSNSGARDDAADIFNEGLIAFFKAVTNRRFQEKSTINTYLFKICKNLWFGKLRKEKRETPLEDKHEAIEAQEDHSKSIEEREKNHLIHQLIRELGEECQKVLYLFYFKKMKMEEIRIDCNLASEQVAKNKKSRCMKSLRLKVQQNPKYWELRNKK